MIRYLREVRLLPIAVVACVCLLALKTADFLLQDNAPVAGNSGTDGDVPVTHAAPGSTLSWATQMFNFPNGGNSAPAPIVAALPPDRMNPDITGSVPETAEKGDAQPKPASLKPPETRPAGTVIPLDSSGLPSGAERAILERLQERRQELDTRARELDIRESLIKAAEKRMDGKLTELKEVESRITAETQQKDDAQAVRFKGLVTMYESMKPRDAAKIFDRLEGGVLLQVTSKIEPRHMADIMAQMSPDTAQRLTVELASRAQEAKQGGGGTTDLPKIQGQSTTP
jgi:flagellar motility protein MotE (MotC chaperone)